MAGVWQSRPAPVWSAEYGRLSRRGLFAEPAFGYPFSDSLSTRLTRATINTAVSHGSGGKVQGFRQDAGLLVLAAGFGAVPGIRKIFRK